jgi:hypothetical protein
MKALLPYQSIDSRIVDLFVEVVDKLSSEDSVKDSLKHLLITYGENSKIFRAIIGYVARTNKVISSYFLNEIVEAYCYFGRAGFHYSGHQIRVILKRVDEADIRKVYKVIALSVLWHADLDSVTHLIFIAVIIIIFFVFCDKHTSRLLKFLWPNFGNSAVTRLRNINYFLRENLLLFLHGCCLACLPSTHSEQAMRWQDESHQARSIVRCFEDHYWIRSLLEYDHIDRELDQRIDSISWC